MRGGRVLRAFTPALLKMKQLVLAAQSLSSAVPGHPAIVRAYGAVAHNDVIWALVERELRVQQPCRQRVPLIPRQPPRLLCLQALDGLLL